MCHSPIVINLLIFNALLETRYVASVTYNYIRFYINYTLVRIGNKRHVHVINRRAFRDVMVT